MEVYVKIIEKLKSVGKYVATMESCTGGGVASEITNHSGSSGVLKFSAVTYSNEYKIKMGVNPKVIEEYSVYSMETAVEMAHNISLFANSNYGIGITGKLNDPDPENDFGSNEEIFICIYDKDKDIDYCYNIGTLKVPREENKKIIIEFIGENFFNILNRDNKLNIDEEKKKILS